ncbi:hypothetical protein [Mumia sp. Pv 4-285]|uniref:hypothetical protein n=1 Tax=Mumia qirimensis TaxID=3234852 RepID=UPI00351D6793
MTLETTGTARNRFGGAPPTTLLGMVSGILALVASFALVPENAASGQTSTRLGRELVTNGSFEDGRRGWRVKPDRRARLKLANPTVRSKRAAVLVGKRSGRVTLDDVGTTVGRAQAGTYRASVLLKGSRRVKGTLVVQHRITTGRQVTTRTTRRAVAVRRGWSRVAVDFSVRAGTALDVRVVARRMKKGRTLSVDQVSLRRHLPRAVTPPPTTKPPVPSPTVRPTPTASPTTDVPTKTLTNGCAYSSRGIPACGTYVGLAVGSNDLPTDFEESAGQPLGVHRTFWQGSQVDGAVAMATRDVADRSIPWLSFKLPHTWPEMAAGAGDAWARDLATRLARLQGPVWVAFHHEPEKDGDIRQWTAIQERFGPIVRAAGPNIGYSVILTGFHQVFGETETYGLDKIWPRTTVDVAGFDVYNRYGVPGSSTTSPADLTTQYFKPLGGWMKARKIAWGVAETGYTHQTAVEDPHWLLDTYHGLSMNGGIAMSYFDSRPASATGDWLLTDPVRGQQYLDILRGSPHIPTAP